jgi:hypothetical protein
MEIKQMINMKTAYLKDFWNYNDLLYILLYLSTIFCDWKLGVDDEEFGEVTRILYSVLIVCGFIRWMAVAKVYETFSLINKMLAQIGNDILPFMFVFFSFIAMFSISLAILNLQLDPALINSDLDPNTITAEES